MYLLKQRPEDFIVREMASHQVLSKGNFALCILKKRNYTTQRAIASVATAMERPIKYFSYAGLKDKNAVTEQFVAIKFATEKEISRFQLKNIAKYSEKAVKKIRYSNDHYASNSPYLKVRLS